MESHLKFPLEKIIKLCERAFYQEMQGHSLLPSQVDEQGNFQGDQEHYLSAIDVQRHQNLINTSEALRQTFLANFSKELVLELPAEPHYSLSSSEIICEMPGVDPKDIRYFFSDTAFAIYAPKKKIKVEESARVFLQINGLLFPTEAYPGFSPKEYLLIQDFDEHLTRDKIEKANKTPHLGVLKIVF